MAMRALLWLLVSGLLASLPAAQAASPDAVSLLSQLPQCALSCLVTSIGSSKCQPTDFDCVCQNTPLQDEITACVLQNCTLKQGLFTKNITETICEAPIRDNGPLSSNWAIILGCASGFFVVLRFGFKLWARLAISSDDWWILITLLAGIPSTVVVVHGTTVNGLGKDIWTVPFDSITKFGFFFYILELLYFIQITVLKMSLMFFFLRIFPSPPVRRLLWGTVAFNVVYCLSFVLIGIFQCRPIDFYWTKWDGEHEGTCLNINALVWSNAAVSIALDVWMLAIPLWQLHGLNLQWKKKVGVGLMFCVGTFVTVMSVLRLQSLVTFANSMNPTWDQFGASFWTVIELNVGIICTCMPTLRLILVRMFPVLGANSRNGYYNNTDNNARSGGHSRGHTAEEPKGTPTSSKIGSITYQKSYSVRFDDSEGDQAALVQMHDLESQKQTPPIRYGQAI
ncbi:putative PTH11-type G-protein coupled receptor protein [Thozetella sp. PMI_491]|nr:putative PTH11-type G-protein coupled receptor protein [Thozetella sp. PMI_491]